MKLFKKKETKKEQIKDKLMELEEHAPVQGMPAAPPQPPAALQEQYAQRPGFPPVQSEQYTMNQLAEGLQEIATLMEQLHNDLKLDIATVAQNQLLWNTNMLNLKTELVLMKERLDKKK